MNAKRTFQWVIALFLLIVLSGTAAVTAQEKPVSEYTPSPPGPPNVFESEPNNSLAMADVMALQDKMSGSDDTACTDVDYYRFNMPRRGYVVIELTNSWSDIALLRSDGTVIVEKDSHARIFYSLPAGPTYIRITPKRFGGVLDCGYDYWLTVMSPLLISATASNLTPGTIDGLPYFHFKAQDILLHTHLNNGYDWWDRLIQGEYIGIKNNVTNVAAGSGDTLLLSLAGNQALPGVGTVTPWDIFIYDPDTLTGEGQTDGTFRWGLKGSQHGLTTAGEKLDAVEGFTEGITSNPLYQGCFGFPVSTAGVATVDGPFGPMKQDDEDIFCKVYNPNYGGWQNWDWFFDVKGKFNRPVTETPPVKVSGLAVEDVVAMAYDDDADVIYLTIQGSGNIWGHAVTQKDIFALNYPSYTWVGIVWHGPDHGWKYNIDAFDWGVE